MLAKKKTKPLPDLPARTGKGTTFAMRLLDWFERGKKAKYPLEELLTIAAAAGYDVAAEVEGHPGLQKIARGLGLLGAAGPREEPPSPPGNGKAARKSKAPPVPSGSPQGELKVLRLGAIRPSPDNPRKVFTELEGLAESIRAQGLLEPLVVRRIFAGDDSAPEVYELVAGERRLRACRMAGLADVPATVIERTAAEAAEAMVAENDQREDLTAGERADGYLLLHEKHGLSVEAIALRIGKSPATVRDLLRLARCLPPAARAALDAGELSPSVAGLISRVAPSVRGELTAWVLAGRQEWDRLDRQSVTVPYSYRAVKEHVREQYTVELKQAPYSLKTVDLTEAGSCDACPKRSGNLQKEDPDGYADMRADVCTEPPCYRAKVQAWKARTLEEAKAKGQKVLSETEAEKQFPFASRQLGYNAGYFDLAAPCQEDREKKTPRTYKQLLEKHLPESAIVLAHDGRGDLHRLVAKDVAMPILRKEYGLFAAAGNGHAATAGAPARTTEEESRERAQRLEDGRIRRAVQDALLGALAGSAATAFSVLGTAPASVLPLLRILVGSIVSSAWGTLIEDVCRRRGLAAKGTTAQRQALRDLADTLGAVELAALLVELQGGQDLLVVRRHDHAAQQTLRALGLDVAAIEKVATAGAAGKGKKKEPRVTGLKPVAAVPVTEAASGDPFDAPLSAIGLDPRHLAALDLAGIETIGQLHDEAAMAVQPVAGYLAGDVDLEEAEARNVADHVSAYLYTHGVRTCGVCGCSEGYCDACVDRLGVPCTWVSERLCSACVAGKDGES